MAKKADPDELRVVARLRGMVAQQGKELLDHGVVRSRAELVAQGIRLQYEKWIMDKERSLRIRSLEESG